MTQVPLTYQSIDFNRQEIDALEREFQQILTELAGNQSLLRFKHEYEKLYRALKRSHQNENILFNKITELSKDMSDQTIKVGVAMNLAKDDAASIAYLKGELDKNFAVLELSKDREQKNKANIQRINSRIKYLQARLDERKNDFTTQSNQLKMLKEEKEDLTKSTLFLPEKQQMNNELSKVKVQLSEHFEKKNILQTERLMVENNVKSIQKELEEVRDKLKKDNDRRKKIQDELDTLKKQKEGTQQEGKKYKREMDNRGREMQQDLKKLGQDEINLSELKSKLNQQTQEYNDMRTNNHDLDIEKTQKNNHSRKLEDDISIKRKDLNQKIIKISQLEKTNDKLRSKLVNKKEKLQAVTPSNQIKKENEVKINRITQLERQVADAKKLNNQDLHHLGQLTQQKRNLEKQLAKQESTASTISQSIKNTEKSISQFQQKIKLNTQANEQKKKKVVALEKEKQKHGKQAALANAKFLQTVEEIKLKGNLISEFQKKNLQTQNALKQQQQRYQTVRSQRNMYSKSLSQTLDQIAQTKRRCKIVGHQINQLKEEISAKEVALSKERHQQKKKDNEIQETSRQNEKKKKENQLKAQKIKNFEGEINKLQAIIKDSEAQRQSLKDKYEIIVADRDILGTQLIRRNDQSSLLYQKIKIQQSTLAKGEAAYRERLSDIKLLQYKLNDLKRQLKIYMKQSDKIPKLKENIADLQKQLIEEKLKVKALSEELENPLNKYRSRKIPGDDDNANPMKQKIQTLQQRLIFKTQQVVQKEVMIHQKQKQIKEMRQIMKSQPGIDSAKKMSFLQQNLKSKTLQMKALAAQLNMYQAQMNESKYEIEKTSKELQQVKRKYYEQKKREQLGKEGQQILQGKER